MTETELKDRLTASVDEIEAAPDVLVRARDGGVRRLRRRRLTTLAISTMAVLAVGGVALTGPGLYSSLNEPPVVGVPVQNDPYGFLMKGHTRGNLANDQAFLQSALLAWKSSHRDSANRSRGIFNHLQGEPQVYWAGTTPAGRAAIIGQYSELRHHDNIQLDREGVHTLVGFVGEKDGKPTVLADNYPAPGVGLQIGFVAGNNALVVLDTGKKVGWSPGRDYRDDGSSGRTYTPVAFKDGVGVVTLPQNTNLLSLALHTLPAKGSSDLDIANGGVNTSPMDDEGRLWSDVEGDGLWPMTPNAQQLAGTAREAFDAALGPVTDPVYYRFSDSIWIGYGVTANGSSVYVGEQQIDNDLTRTYAVLKPKNGKARIIPGGVPDVNAGPLPVKIKLPDGQGWVVAVQDAKLSYRFGEDGTWSAESPHALLVPDGEQAEVQVATPSGTQTETLP